MAVNYQTAEYGKFVELSQSSSYPPVSVVRWSYPDTSAAFPTNSGALPVSSVDIYPKFAVLSQIANTEDFDVTLSAGNINLDLTNVENLISTSNAIALGHSYQLSAVEFYIDDLEKNTFDTASACDDIYWEVSRLNSQTNILTANSYYGTISTLPSYITSTQDYPNIVEFRDSPQLAPFGRLRVTNAVTIFDFKTLYSKEARFFWNSALLSSIEVFNDNDASRTLFLTGANGYYITETYRRFPYQPGRGQSVTFTGVISAEPNVVKRFGLYSSLSGNNYFQRPIGIYFQALSSTNTPNSNQQYAWVINNSSLGSDAASLVPPQSATQAEWNIDKMDGTGPSGINLDFSKSQIFMFDFQWLGVGRVRFGFNVNGKTYVCHEFDHANKINGTYMRTPNLPFRGEIRGLNGASSGSMKIICGAVNSEGLIDTANVTRSCSLSSGISPGGIGQAYRKAILGIRLKADRLNATNRVIAADAIPILTNSSDIGAYRWELVMRPTSISNTIVWHPVSDSSSFEYGFDGSNGSTITGGEVIACGFASGQSNIALNNPELDRVVVLGRSLTQVRDELWLVITPLSKTFDFWGSFTVAEAD